MDATGVKEIARMQSKIECYELFLHNILYKLKDSNHKFLQVNIDEETDIMNTIFMEIDKLQNKEERK